MLFYVAACLFWGVCSHKENCGQMKTHHNKTPFLRHTEFPGYCYCYGNCLFFLELCMLPIKMRPLQIFLRIHLLYSIYTITTAFMLECCNNHGEDYSPQLSKTGATVLLRRKMGQCSAKSSGVHNKIILVQYCAKQDNCEWTIVCTAL